MGSRCGDDRSKTFSLPSPDSVPTAKTTKKKETKAQVFTFFFVFFSEKRTHTTCFHTRAVSRVGHFGSAVTILDRRVVSLSQNGGGTADDVADG